MCGICGIIDPRGGLGDGATQSMAATLVHRGPDDAGTYLSGDRRIALGFRRLSIVDLSPHGHQPMCNEDGSVWIVFNGEIYNHLDLRRELLTNGHQYRSQTDTETVLHGYEEWGEDVVHRLRGMFAFAIWDSRRGAALLARDRIGIKPLYYSQEGGKLAFASEIKAILALPWIGRAVNARGLQQYLTFAAVPAPETMFDGIHKLPAAHLMRVGVDGRVETKRYWSPVFPEDHGLGEAEGPCVERLRAMLTESIRLRMMSDVPFGVFLSGGIDSSLNVALMSKFMERPVDTYSVAISDDPVSDELGAAREVAAHFRTNHHEVRIGTPEFLGFLPQMAHHQDEPLADPVCVPLYYVSRLARQNGTIVVQVGEGSDELFCGYRSFARYLDILPLYRAIRAMPGPMRRTLGSAGARFLRPSWAGYLELAAAGAPLFWGGAIGFDEREKASLLAGRLQPGLAASWVEARHEEWRRAGGRGTYLDEMIYVELAHRLPELLLMRVDKMTMATSVEARVPYLDHELVRFALSVPANLKCHGGTLKYILKKAARGLIPDAVIERPKAGFCGSASNMVTARVVDALELLVRRNRGLDGLLDWNLLAALIARHRKGEVQTGYRLWVLLNLALWHTAWIQRVDPEQTCAWLGVEDGGEVARG